MKVVFDNVNVIGHDGLARVTLYGVRDFEFTDETLEMHYENGTINRVPREDIGELIQAIDDAEVPDELADEVLESTDDHLVYDRRAQ